MINIFVLNLCLTCTGDVRSGRMKSNIENTLVKLLSMRCDLLNTCFALQVPQPAEAIN